MTSHAYGIATTTLVAQAVAGAIAFFVFFAGMFNGRTMLMVSAAAIGLAVNLLVSRRLARRSRATGAVAATAFGAAAVLFAVFSLGDLLAQGDAQPFLFWSSAAAAAIGAGLLGVFLAPKCR
jgi:hypothetical protein